MTQGKLDPWQFRISREVSPGAIKVAGLFLETGAGIGVTKILDANANAMGIVLGFAIDLDVGTPLDPSGSHAVAHVLGADPDDFAEQVIASLAGRFLFIFAPDSDTGSGPLARIYPDCAAQVPCVYDPALKIAASTSHAMLGEAQYQERFDRALYDKLDVMREGWFPCGLTAHRGIERLLPNHYLDLHTWVVKRHWPGSEITVSQNPMQNVEELVSLVRAQLDILSRGPRKIIQGLTAGHETRVLLACARPAVKQMAFVTITGSDRHECDTIMARRIARDQGLEHMEIPRVSATRSQRDLFIRRGGHCIGDSNVLYHPSIWPLKDKFILLGGAGGEIARAFFWHPSDTPDTYISPERLTGRLGLARLDVVTAGFDAWLKDLPLEDTLIRLDLAYIEQRMGPWGSAQFYCDPTLVRVSPLVTRRAVELMLSLPADWKRTNRLSNAIIQQDWPELARYPYNSLGVWKDGLAKLRRVMQNPRIILKKLRKLSR